jgi:hypothetical protein
MLSNTVAIQFLLGVAGLTQAQMPPNVFPQVNNNLAVQYNDEVINPGQTIATQGSFIVIERHSTKLTKLSCTITANHRSKLVFGRCGRKSEIYICNGWLVVTPPHLVSRSQTNDGSIIDIDA